MTVADLAILLSLIALLVAINTQRKGKNMVTAAQLNALADNVTAFRSEILGLIEAEGAQHAKAVQELKDLIKDGSTHTSAELDAAFANVEGAFSNLAAGMRISIAAIVKDEPDTPPAEGGSTETGGGPTTET